MQLTKKILGFIVLGLQCQLSVAQITGTTLAENPVFVGVNFHPLGYIIPHSSELKQVDLRNPLGVQLDFGWHLNTQKTWN